MNKASLSDASADFSLFLCLRNLFDDMLQNDISEANIIGRIGAAQSGLRSAWVGSLAGEHACHARQATPALAGAHL